MVNKLRLLPILIIMLTFSGCWDFEEVDRRAFATTIGIDPAPGGVEISVQTPLPQKMLPPGNKGETQGKVFSTISSIGSTLNEAFDTMQTKTYQDLVIQQNKSVIIGTELARQGVGSVLDYLVRNPKAPPQAYVFVAKKSTAREILTAAPVDQILPGLMFGQSAQAIVKYNRTFFIPLWLFEQKLIHGSKDPFAPLISFDPGEGVFVESGLAVFNRDRMVGELDPRQTQMFGILSGLMKEGSLTMRPPQTTLTLRNLRGKTKLAISMRRGVPFFTVNCTISGKIDELTGWTNRPLKPEVIRSLERSIQAALNPELTATIKQLQSLRSDIINFGEELRVQHYGFWKHVDWEKLYPSAGFKVAIKVRILGNGVLH